MIQEIKDGLDIHTANAKNIFGDIKYRQDAKILTFRTIYGGTAYAFYMDGKMPAFSLKKWESIVSAFYEKYSRLKEWQDENFALVCKQGWMQSFTGRIYKFDMKHQKDGSYAYERPGVCNYIVQGTSTGDIVPLVMVQIHRRLRTLGLLDRVKIINQVHDSIVFDLPKELVDITAKICIEYFQKIPQSVKAYWGYPWVCPMDGEIKVGETNWSEMQKYKI
jgi:DNA polymerase I-like protein with 3'-5' exonuclease and polymerase domains